MSRGYDEEIDVDMIPGGRVGICHASQYDVNRKIRINLYKEKSTAFLGAGATVKLSVRKVDGTVISTDDSSIISIKTEEPEFGGVWYYILLCTTQQMTACYGRNQCEIVVTETEDNITSVIGSANFILQVEKDPLDGGIESESVISDLQAQVDACVEHSLNITSINDLADVDAESATDGQALVYDEVNDKWVPGAGGGGGASNLSDLDDVYLSNLADMHTLVYDNVRQVWSNVLNSLQNLSNVVITSLPTSGQALIYDATNNRWTNGSVASALDDLTDVNISSDAQSSSSGLVSGQNLRLKKNYTTNEITWENKANTILIDTLVGAGEYDADLYYRGSELPPISDIEDEGFIYEPEVFASIKNPGVYSIEKVEAKHYKVKFIPHDQQWRLALLFTTQPPEQIR